MLVPISPRTMPNGTDAPGLSTTVNPQTSHHRHKTHIPDIAKVVRPNENVHKLREIDVGCGVSCCLDCSADPLLDLRGWLRVCDVACRKKGCRQDEKTRDRHERSRWQMRDDAPMLFRTSLSIVSVCRAAVSVRTMPAERAANNYEHMQRIPGRCRVIAGKCGGAARDGASSYLLVSASDTEEAVSRVLLFTATSCAETEVGHGGQPGAVSGNAVEQAESRREKERIVGA